MSADYRTMTRQALARATAIVSRNETGIRSAALELREALEFITYDRMLQYKDEISLKEYENREPQYIVNLLGEIDPTGALTESIFFCREEEAENAEGASDAARPAADLTHADLKKRYDSLERFLRARTVEQIRTGKNWTETDLRAECEASISFVERVLSAKLVRSRPAVFASFGCARCKKLVTRRLNQDSTEQIRATCIECGASYTATPQPTGKLEWSADVLTIPCGTEGCDYERDLWPEQVRPGAGWTCPGCKALWVLYMGWGKLERAEPPDIEAPTAEESIREGGQNAN